MAEFFHFSFMSPGERMKMLLNPGELDKLKPLIEGGKGCLLMTAHLGNWELMLGIFSAMADTVFLSRREKDYHRFVTEVRGRYGVSALYDSDASAREMGRLAAGGSFVAFVYDRNLRRTKGIMADFFGHPAFCPYFPVNAALEGEVPVVPAVLVREKSGYRLHVGEPIHLDHRESSMDAYREYIPKLLSHIEEYIRRYPEQWFWANRRWDKAKGEVRE